MLYCEEDIDDVDPGKRNPISIFSDDMDFECAMPDFAKSIPMSHSSLLDHSLYSCIDSPKALFARCDENPDEARLCMWLQSEGMFTSTINFLVGRVLLYHVDGSERIILMELSAFMYEQTMLDPPMHSKNIGHVAFKDNNTLTILNPEQWNPSSSGVDKKTIEENIAAMLVPFNRLGVVQTRFRLPHKVKLWCHYNKIRMVN